ncbi:MAG: M23 family metallopeptidase [Sporolactobacillus sp.]|jgi:murein DD-endopeptidase MepM/ murein hydrolase activator NlpD|nr:M23 family metallopeptidase [Sporolactobacillus sp.]
MKKVRFCIAACLMFFLFLWVDRTPANGADWAFAGDKALYLKTAAVTGVPWYTLAGCDRYLANIEQDGKIATPMRIREWAGPLNPDPQNSNPATIALFGGIGKDGNGDGKAQPSNPEDRLYTLGERLAAAGPGEANRRIAIWNLFRRGKAVEMIDAFARLYRTFDTVDLNGHAFPVPLTANYDYEPTWGARRGWGGLRIHEGTDIFADYGTPVRATAYGIIDMIGWNKYGGWRIGLRDLQGNYHYFAHLNGYAPHMHRAAAVHPGQTIGYVGSSGYGPKGTMGKFPAHLHYGLYRDNGRAEFSVDPYPLLRMWERQETKQTNN